MGDGIKIDINFICLTCNPYKRCMLLNHMCVHICRKTINNRHNQAVMTKLIKEVKGLNPSMDAADIRSELNEV